MQAYKNIGPAWRRSNGEIVNQGEMFRPTGIELERMDQRHQIGTRFVPVTRDEFESVVGATQDAPPVPVSIVGDGETEDAKDSTGDGDESGNEDKTPKLAPWPMKMSPEQYLKLHKSGPQAQLAKQYIDAGLGATRGG